MPVLHAGHATTAPGRRHRRKAAELVARARKEIAEGDGIAAEVEVKVGPAGLMGGEPAVQVGDVGVEQGPGHGGRA